MGIPINHCTLYKFSFPDDQIVMTQDYDDVDIEEYKKWRLEENIAKTEHMSVKGSQQDLILKNGQRLKNCQKYKYLSVNITHGGTLDDAII